MVSLFRVIVSRCHFFEQIVSGCHFFRQIFSRVSDYIHCRKNICINASPWYFTNNFLTHQTSPPYNTPVNSISDSHFRKLQTPFCSEHKCACTLLSCESYRNEPPTMRFCTCHSRIFSSFSWVAERSQHHSFCSAVYSCQHYLRLLLSRTFGSRIWLYLCSNQAVLRSCWKVLPVPWVRLFFFSVLLSS